MVGSERDLSWAPASRLSGCQRPARPAAPPRDVGRGSPATRDTARCEDCPKHCPARPQPRTTGSPLAIVMPPSFALRGDVTSAACARSGRRNAVSTGPGLAPRCRASCAARASQLRCIPRWAQRRVLPQRRLVHATASRREGTGLRRVACAVPCARLPTAAREHASVRGGRAARERVAASVAVSESVAGLGRPWRGDGERDRTRSIG